MILNIEQEMWLKGAVDELVKEAFMAGVEYGKKEAASSAPIDAYTRQAKFGATQAMTDVHTILNEKYQFLKGAK